MYFLGGDKQPGTEFLLLHKSEVATEVGLQFP